jgi:phosphosulfolactate synthase
MIPKPGQSMFEGGGIKTDRTGSSVLRGILDPKIRTAKPRDYGITMLLDRGEMGPTAVRDLSAVMAEFADYAKIAWASALITGALEEKIAAYRASGITPLLGGTLFEYAILRNRVEDLFSAVCEMKIHLEISDGVAEVPRREKLRWIERFAAHVEVYSEVGGKLARQNLDWRQVIAEELNAGAKKVVIEGREIAAVGADVREEFIHALLASADPKKLVFEALERKQQWMLIKLMGPNVNLGNIPPMEVIAVESYRRGLKDRTMIEIWKRGV